MSQYIIDIKNEQQAEGLIKYLKTLPFVELKSVIPDRKAEAIARAKSFLEGLPDQPQKQSDVNKAVKTIRKKHGYQ